MSATEKTDVRCYSGHLLSESSFSAAKVTGLSWADLGVLLIFVAGGLIAVLHHVPGMDEAQGWLIARDLSVPGILRQMRYEGTPPLWHLLLSFLIRLHLPYSGLGFVPLTMLGAAVYVWLRWSPLPLVVRLLVPFAFFFQYQYAVVARSYSLSTLLAFVAAALWRRKPLRVIPLAVVLALLVQTNLYGFAMGAGIALAVAAEYCFPKQWERTEQKPGRMLLAAVLVIGSLLAAWYIARPAPDNFDAIRYYAPLHKRLLSMVLYIGPGSLAQWVAPLAQSLAVPAGSLSAAVLFLVIWFIAIKRYFCFLPLLCTLAAMNLVFWTSWHSGMALVALLVSLWAAWPQRPVTEARWLTPLLVGLLSLVLFVQIPATVGAIRHQLVDPSSPGKQAAEFLKPMVGKRPIYGANYYSGVVLPYFPENIFANRSPRVGVWTKSSETIRQEKQMLASAFTPDSVVVFGSVDAPDTDPAHRPPHDPLDVMLARGSMHKTHIFCGKMIWFSGFFRQDCVITYEYRPDSQ
ncbi:MAG: hypothetical protein ABR866_18835 [Candidatus Korobacteraceae bacterium]|jgi:hypothetical protein